MSYRYSHLALRVVLFASLCMASRAGASTEVRFQETASVIFVYAKADGYYRRLSFLFDTGASRTILDERLAEKLKLAVKGPARVSALAGAFDAHRADGLSARVGDLPLPVECFVMDLKAIGRVCRRRVDGIIGIGDFILPRRKIIYQPGSTFAGEQGLLGNRTLSKFFVTLDPGRQCIYLANPRLPASRRSD